MKCDSRRLSELLLRETAASEHVEQELSRHLESCAQCRDLVTEMAAPSSWWKEASTVLEEDMNYRSTIIVSLESAMSEDADIQADEVSLDFLEPPSHPEMLGRLGRYEIERVIGMGGMGIVLKAFDTELNRPVAIKALAPHLSHSGAARRRFAREAQAAAAVIHENVIPIHDVQDASELPYLVMQYVPGESLQARIERDGPLSIDEVLRISAQVADGLAAAHAQGLVHRDVKPANILLQDGVDRVTISDFGLARTADDASLTRTGVVAGTPHYMSPEQARGTSIDCRSDQFGLGSVIYFMCTGHPPFRADGAMAVLNRICHDVHRPVDESNPQVPVVLSDVVDRLLSKSPEQRYASTDEVCRQLADILSDWRMPARRRSMVRRESPARNRVLAAAAGMAGVLLLLMLLFSLVRPWPLPGRPDRDSASHVVPKFAAPVPPDLARMDSPDQPLVNQPTEFRDAQLALPAAGVTASSPYLPPSDEIQTEVESLQTRILKLEMDWETADDEYGGWDQDVAWELELQQIETGIIQIEEPTE